MSRFLPFCWLMFGMLLVPRVLGASAVGGLSLTANTQDSSQQYGCFFLDLKCIADAEIQQAENWLTGAGLEAFEQAIDHIVTEDIDPLIDKVQSAIDAAVKEVSAEINATVDHVKVAIEDIIEDAAKTAESLAANVTSDIEKIIQQASDAVEKVEQTFFDDASKLLDQINAIVQKGQCMEAGGAKQIQDQIYKLLKELNPFYHLSACWRELGFKATQTLEDLTDVQLYDYQKQCTLLSHITPTTPIDGPNGILQIYAQGQLYAAEYYCIGETAGSPAFQDVFTKEWVWWGVQYNAWKTTTASLSSLNDPTCGTPVECYAEAIKELHNAEQMIEPLQEAVTGFRKNLSAISDDLSTNASLLHSVRTQVSENTNKTLANADATSANAKQVNVNAAAIKGNTNSISGLSKQTPYACNCFEIGPKDTCTLPNGNYGILNYNYICESDGCSDSISVVTDTSQGDGKGGGFCCDICFGTQEQAVEHARANPIGDLLYRF